MIRMSWFKAYQSINALTIAELKELLKASGMPVSGKKRDLVGYLVFKAWPHIPIPKNAHDQGLWLQTAYNRYLDGHGTFDAIN